MAGSLNPSEPKTVPLKSAALVAAGGAGVAPVAKPPPGRKVAPPVNVPPAFIPPTPEQIRNQPASVTAAQILSQRLNMRDPAVRAEVTRWLTLSYETRKKAAWELAKQRGLPTEGSKPGGGSFLLEDFEDGRPVYKATDNVEAAISTAANLVRGAASYDDVIGDTQTVGVWDGAGARLTHQEFEGRVTAHDPNAPLTSHPTHVIGTIAAAGINAQVMGMAPAASVEYYDFSNDMAEMTSAGAATASDGKLLLSNGSYGFLSGWEWNGTTYIWRGLFSNDGDPTNDVEDGFGRYDANAVALDGLAFNEPYFLMVRSAGNERNNGPPATGSNWTDTNTNTVYAYDPAQHPRGDGQYAGGYDTLSGEKTAKNILVVGAVDDAVVSQQRNLPAATMAAFSSWGPTDDGRIKPDVVGNGVQVYSTIETSDTAVDFSSGTSMATPNVTGSAVLLQEFYQFREPQALPMRADMLRGLIIHTADDLGTAGPDYQFGWGLMNTKAAADVIKKHFNNKNGAALYTGVNVTGELKKYQLTWDGTKPLRVTLCWTDPPGVATNQHDDSTTKLVNDLELRVRRPDDVTVDMPFVMPFAMSAGGSSLAAVRDENHWDNVEQVLIDTPLPAGLYTIEIDRSGIGDGNAQNYALIISGNKAPPALAVSDDANSTLTSGSSRVDFGYLPVGAARTRTFTIRNTASSASLTGISVAKDPSDPADYVITQPASTVPGNGSTTFTVTFHSTQPGPSTATLSITSNDPENNPFTIALAAIAPVAGDVGQGWTKGINDEVAFDSSGNVITRNGAKLAHGNGALIWQWSGASTVASLIGVESFDNIVGFDSAAGLFRLSGSTGAPIPGPQGALINLNNVFSFRNECDAQGNWFTYGENAAPNTERFVKKSYATGATLWQQDVPFNPLGDDDDTSSGEDIFAAFPDGVLNIAGSNASTFDEDTGETHTTDTLYFKKRSGSTGAELWSSEHFVVHDNHCSVPLPVSAPVVDANGDFFYAAEKYDDALGASDSTMYLQKRSGATGGLLWSVGGWKIKRPSGVLPFYNSPGVALDSDGNLLVTHGGRTEKRSGSNGVFLWRKDLPFESGKVACGGSNLVAVTGTLFTSQAYTFTRSYFTASLDGSDGHLRWTRAFDETYDSGYKPNYIQADTLGNVAVSGNVDWGASGLLIVYPVGGGGGTITVASNQPLVVTSEGQSVQNTGTFSSSAGNAGVTLTATKGGSSFGTVTKNDANGTWTWTHTPGNGPSDGGTVTISASDGSAPVTSTFTLIVNNVAPTFNAGGNAIVNPAQSVLFSRTITFVDPGTDNWTASVDYGDGSGPTSVFVNQAAKSVDLAHPYFTGGPFTVTVTISDGDPGGSTTNSFTVAIGVPRILNDWRLLHFGTSDNTGDAADLANPAHDGIANLLKFAFNLDPHQSVPSTALPQMTVGGGGSEAQSTQSSGTPASIGYTFTEPSGTIGILYGAEYSDDLTTWLPITDTGAGGTHIFSVPANANTRLFVRLRVTVAP